MNCRIEKESIYLNGEEVFTATGEDFSSFAKGAYRHLELNYPKFFKMDKLSKLAFLGAEYLLMGYSATEKEGTALVLANRSGSLDTDLVHQQALEAGEPASPAVFVYTLANICLGEIAIRHQLRSEGHFFCFRPLSRGIFYTIQSVPCTGGTCRAGTLWLGGAFGSGLLLEVRDILTKNE